MNASDFPTFHGSACIPQLPQAEFHELNQLHEVIDSSEKVRGYLMRLTRKLKVLFSLLMQMIALDEAKSSSSSSYCGEQYNPTNRWLDEKLTPTLERYTRCTQ